MKWSELRSTARIATGWLACVLFLGGCAAASTQERAPSTVLPGLVEDAKRFVQSTDAGRFEVLTRLLRERDIAFQVQEYTDDARTRDPRGRNVIVTLGDGPRDLVIGAHYDAVGLADGSLSPGAVDNTASAVILIRLAQALRGRALTHRIRIVFFDMEEEGLIGAKHFLPPNRDRIAAMLNLDIGGYGDTLLVGTASSYPPIQRAVRHVCGKVDIGCIAFPQLPPGDDRVFESAKIPNASFAILPALEAHQLWLLLNAPNTLREEAEPRILRIIHSANDTIEKLDARAMTRMYDALLGIVLELDRTIS